MGTNRCVCCGAEIPEGRQVCAKCEMEDDLIMRKNRMSVIHEIVRYSAWFIIGMSIGVLISYLLL